MTWRAISRVKPNMSSARRSPMTDARRAAELCERIGRISGRGLTANLKGRAPLPILIAAVTLVGECRIPHRSSRLDRGFRHGVFGCRDTSPRVERIIMKIFQFDLACSTRPISRSGKGSSPHA